MITEPEPTLVIPTSRPPRAPKAFQSRYGVSPSHYRATQSRSTGAVLTERAG